jgi:predicted ArsR family transcriptional regulator
MPREAVPSTPVDVADLLEALGDDTRTALFRELALATHGLTATELADRVGLHANTVRLHLEGMRDAGLLELEVVHRGTVGRPQHVYSLAPDIPTGAIEPAAHELLAGLLAALADRVGAAAEDAVAAGRAYGRAAALRNRPSRSTPGQPRCVASLMSHMRRLGFDPALDDADDEPTLYFLQCPFRELAEAYPELVCSLHRGICEGVVAAAGGGKIGRFHPLYDHTPCQADVHVG